MKRVLRERTFSGVYDLFGKNYRYHILSISLYGLLTSCIANLVDARMFGEIKGRDALML